MCIINFSARFACCLLLLSVSTAHALVTATGSVTPSNPSKWTSLTEGKIGDSSDGAILVNAGSVIDAGDCKIGLLSGLTGTATISTGSTWNCNEICVGDYGSGVLNITNGGMVSNGTSVLGYITNSTGTANVSGSGSIWENSGNLTVGQYGKGTLDIADGGQVKIRNTLTIDTDNTGLSFINMSTGGQLILLGEADNSLAEFLTLVDGTGAIRWKNSLGNWASLATATPGVNYTLGCLTENGLDYTRLTVGSVAGPGDVNGDGVVNGSDVAILAGNWQVPTGATWTMGDLSGDGTVNGSDIAILAGNWQVQTGATWEMGDLSDDGAVNGSDVAILADNWQTGVTAVPEPGALLMLLFGLLALGLVRHIK